MCFESWVMMKRSSAEIYVVVFYMMTITNLKKAFDGVFLKKRLQQEEIKFHIDLIPIQIHFKNESVSKNWRWHWFPRDVVLQGCWCFKDLILIFFSFLNFNLMVETEIFEQILFALYYMKEDWWKPCVPPTRSSTVGTMFMSAQRGLIFVV